MLEPGKYDDLSETLLKALGAKGVVLVVIDGMRGHGLSCSMREDLLRQMPNILRSVADRIEASTQDQKNN